MSAIFTQDELEALRRFDAMIDAGPMTAEDYHISDFVEELLFPKKARTRKAAHARYEGSKEQISEKGRRYRETHKEQEAARKKAWYEANRGRILAQQKEYRKRRCTASA